MSNKIAKLCSKRVHFLGDNKILTPGVIISARKEKKKAVYLIVLLHIISDFFRVVKCPNKVLLKLHFQRETNDPPVRGGGAY